MGARDLVVVMAFVGFGLFPACAGAPPPSPLPPSPSPPVAGAAGATGRIGVHGMIVFGKDHVFMSHIPMYRAPHDAQMVIEVEIPGHPPFDDALYTFEPERFSLDALARGEKREIAGTIYRGNFEDGGAPLLKDVRAKVVRIVASRMGLEDAPRAMTYWIIPDGDSDAYLVHVLGKAPSFDQIVLVRGQHGSLVAFDARADVAASRVAPGVPLGAATFVREVSCLAGPDFDKPCDALK